MEEEFDLPDDLKPSCSKDVKQPRVRDQFPGACLVCLNPSTGYHYDVPSCNGCKSFFRRTLIQEDVPYCSKIGKCYTSVVPIDMSRKTCRGCRFEKCVISGMNPLGIQTSVVNMEKAKVMIAEVLKRRKAGRELVNVEGAGRFISPDEAVSKVISNLDVIEGHTKQIHFDGLPSGIHDCRSLQDILNSPANFKNTEIPHLIENDSAGLCHKNMTFAHCSLLASVEYAKTFDFFRKISLEDQLRLMRHVTLACANLHDAFFSITHFKSDRLRHPDGSEIGKKIERGEKPGFHLTVLLSVLRNGLNRVEYMLLKAIVMCNSTVCSLSFPTQSILEEERRKFGACLLRYCRLEHGAVHGPSRFAALLSLVSIIENQVKLQKDFFVYVKVVLRRENECRYPVTSLFEDVMGN